MNQPTNEPSNQSLPDTLVEDRLRGLALAVPVTETDAAADVGRGRTRVRRQRLVVGAAAVATAAVVGVGATVVDDVAGPGEQGVPAASSRTAPSTAPSSSPSSSPRNSAAPADERTLEEYLADQRAIVGDTLDPTGEHLDLGSSGVQTTGAGVGQKLAWSNPGEEGLGVVQVFVSPDWASQFEMLCDRFQDCREVRDGGVGGRTLTDGSTTWVGVDHPADGPVVVLSVDTLFGNSSTVPVSGIDLSVRDLLRAAADERFTTPTAKQADGELPGRLGDLMRRADAAERSTTAPE